MPQPLSRVKPGALFIPDSECLKDKPKLTALVAAIFAYAARIEYWQSLLLVRVLGADADPAIAMFSTLRAQHLQLGALQAAAKAALSAQEFAVFITSTKVAEAVQAPRNQLAHWIWGHSPQLPNALLLADPDAETERDRKLTLFLEQTDQVNRVNISEFVRLSTHDRKDTILVYTEADLQRAKRDIKDAAEVAGLVTAYLDSLFRGRRKVPATTNVAPTREALFQKLYAIRMFHEVWDRNQANDPQKPHQLPPGSPQQGPNG